MKIELIPPVSRKLVEKTNIFPCSLRLSGPHLPIQAKLGLITLDFKHVNSAQLSESLQAKPIAFSYITTQ